MSFQQITLNVLNLVAFIFGVLSIGVGYFGLVKKHPILFPALYYNGFVFFIFMLGLILSFTLFFSPQRVGNSFLIVAPFILLVLFTWMVFFSRRQISGYMIFGIYDETFRDAITHALKS